MPAPTDPTPGIWPSIRAAFRQNLWPCVMLNILVVSLVASYYLWPQVAGIWAAVGTLKTKWSYGFSLSSTVLSAVLLPFAAQGLMGTLPQNGRMRRFLGQALFWGYRGMEIDLFYRIQALMFGHGNDPATLATKVVMDQFVYSTLWAVPTYVIALRWIDQGGSWTDTHATLDRHFWRHTYPSILITNWIIWIPTVALVYSLPSPLQFPLFSVVMCVFVLIVTLLAKGSVKTADTK